MHHFENFAYEVGVGFQYALSTKKTQPILALDYRFMDLGQAGLSTYTNQPNNNALNFGHLRIQSANLSVIFPIS